MHSLNAELNFICHLLALLGGANIVVVSRLRVNAYDLQKVSSFQNCNPNFKSYLATIMHRVHHVTRHNTLIHNILSTAPQWSISQKALGTLPEDGNVMPKHVGATIHN